MIADSKKAKVVQNIFCFTVNYYYTSIIPVS